MGQSLDERVKDIMSLKERIGEFSLDLYYNDFDKEMPYVAKVHSAAFKEVSFHARSKSFDACLDIVEEKLYVLDSIAVLTIKEIRTY